MTFVAYETLLHQRWIRSRTVGRGEQCSQGQNIFTINENA